VLFLFEKVPGITRRSRIGILDVTDIATDEESRSNIKWCANCEQLGIHNKLGKRIYLPDPDHPDEPVIIPHDADNWLQCGKCGTVIPRYEARGEGELQIDSEYELIESPFDFAQGIFEPIGTSRKIDRSALQNRTQKKLRKKQLAAVDSDIQAELKAGGEISDYTKTVL
jgi:hypothetical protein